MLCFMLCSHFIPCLSVSKSFPSGHHRRPYSGTVERLRIADVGMIPDQASANLFRMTVRHQVSAAPVMPVRCIVDAPVFCIGPGGGFRLDVHRTVSEEHLHDRQLDPGIKLRGCSVDRVNMKPVISAVYIVIVRFSLLPQNSGGAIPRFSIIRAGGIRIVIGSLSASGIFHNQTVGIVIFPGHVGNEILVVVHIADITDSDLFQVTQAERTSAGFPGLAQRRQK